MTPAPPTPTIDLNCDMGESDDPAQIAIDDRLLSLISSANIACGGHAGSEATMSRTIAAALQHGVAIGAHPGYPDPTRFGRVELDMTPEQIQHSVAGQLQALELVARRHQAKILHLKPHGALYHAAMSREPVARAIALAARQVIPSLTLVGLAGAPALDIWRSMGFAVLSEAFADRRYQPDGSLCPRNLPGAVLESPEQAGNQATRIALQQPIETSEPTTLLVKADTLCIHSDTPGAPSVAAAVRSALIQAGIRVCRHRHG